MPTLALKRLSYSTLAKLDACPSKLFLTKGTPYTSVPTLAGVAGRAFHKLAEEFDASGWWGEEYSHLWDEAASRILAGEIAQEIEETAVPFEEWRVSGRASKAWPNKEDLAWWNHHLPIMGKAYAAWRAANLQLVDWVTPDGEPANELEIKVSIPGVETPFLAFIDKVMVDTSKGGALVVLDLKSGSMPIEDLTQHITYASLLEIRYGVRPEFGAIYNARVGDLVPIRKGGPTLMPLGHVSTATWLKGVQARQRIIDLGEFPAKPGKHCGWCDVRKACTWAAGPDAWRYDPQHPAYKGSVELAA